MAGEAKTSAFMLGTATVMLGPQADVFNLTPDEHSIGLVKNFAVTAEPNYLDLTQGVRNTIVYSVLTAFPVRATMEVYEYTSKNIAYGLSLEGFNYTSKAASVPLGNSLAGGASATSVDVPVASDISAQFKAGDWITIQEQAGGRDLVHIAKLTSDGSYTAGGSGGTLKLTFTNHPIPADVSFSALARVRAQNMIGIGEKKEQPFFGAKVVGLLPEGNEPITLIYPKVRILRGFNLSFSTENYGNMPFEFTPFELTSQDPHYATFRDLGVGMLLTGN